MNNSGEKANQAARCVNDDESDMSNRKEIFSLGTKQNPHSQPKRNNIIGFPDDLRINLLTLENQRLKALVEDLILDKQSQARRIMELNEEKLRLKKALADMILEGENGERALL